MPTLHDLMAESIDGRARMLRAADAAPAGATRGLIGRRRRRNAAMVGGTSALAVGGLVAAGIVQDARRDDAPASFDPDAIQYVTSDVDDLANLDTGFLYCGDKVPPTLTEDQGFTQSIAVDRAGNSSDTLRITAAVDYNGADRAPAFVNRGYAVLAHDGAVVGYSINSGSVGDGFETVTGGSHWNAGRVVDGSMFQYGPCREDYMTSPSPDDVAYPAGEYEIYVVSQADTSAPLVALHELMGEGYYLASGTTRVLNPGSIDCEMESEQKAKLGHSPTGPMRRVLAAGRATRPSVW